MAKSSQALIAAVCFLSLAYLCFAMIGPGEQQTWCVTMDRSMMPCVL